MNRGGGGQNPFLIILQTTVTANAYKADTYGIFATGVLQKMNCLKGQKNDRK